MNGHFAHRRTMAWLVVLAIAIGVVASSCRGGETSAAKYQCPMHPTYVSDRPGDCPICGMRLVEIKGSSTGQAARTDKAAPPPGGAQAGTRAEKYTCPMHLNVISDGPGKCPYCGMDLVPVSSLAPAAGAPAGAHGGASQPAPSSVSDMAAVEIGPDARRLAGVGTARAVRETVSRTIRTVGTVVVDETRVRHVHTKIAGWVERLSVNFTGQFVRQGEPLLSIYSPELVASQEEFLRARAAAARFQASELPEVRRGGDDLVAASRRRLQSFDVPDAFIADLERTGRPERAVTLLAPVSGYVTAKAVFEGHQVEPGMELLTITDLSHVWIEGDFYEFDAPAVRLGQTARLELVYAPGTAIVGRVSYIYPTLDVETRTLRVRFDVPNPTLQLKPGMFVNVELHAGASTALTIPDSAVIDTGERQVVFVDTGGGRLEPREVRVGLREGGKAQVVAGLTEGESVAVRANFLLDSESRLRAALAGLTAVPAPKPPVAKKEPDGARP